MIKKKVNRSAWDAKYDNRDTVTICWRPTRYTTREVIVGGITPSVARDITDAVEDLITRCKREILAAAVGLPESLWQGGPRDLKEGAFRVDSLSQEKRELLQTILDRLDNQSWSCEY